MDGDNKAVLDLRIRQAMNYGFDRQKMITYLRNNMGTPAVNGIIPTGLPSFNDAKGYTDKKQRTWSMSIRRLRVIKPVIQLSTNASYVDIESFAKEWQKIGLDVQVDISPPSTLRQSISTGKVFFRASWIADYPMPRIIYPYFTVRTSLRWAKLYPF
jgi:peptide/nickel transport system substrate-binding protein